METPPTRGSRRSSSEHTRAPSSSIPSAPPTDYSPSSANPTEAPSIPNPTTAPSHLPTSSSPTSAPTSTETPSGFPSVSPTGAVYAFHLDTSVGQHASPLPTHRLNVSIVSVLVIDRCGTTSYRQICGLDGRKFQLYRSQS